MNSKTPLTDQVRELVAHARRLESALAVAEGALKVSHGYLHERVSGTGGKGDTVVLPKLREAMRAIEKIKEA